MKLVSKPDIDRWAETISDRISDEVPYQLEDRLLLKSVLMNILPSHPEEMERLIGSGVIEEDYFD